MGAVVIMLKLQSNSITTLTDLVSCRAGVYRLSTNQSPELEWSVKELFIVRGAEKPVPSGFAGYLYFEKPAYLLPSDSFLLEPGLSYLQAGDIVKLTPSQNSLRVLYRRNSSHNFFLLTERCNHLCLMCSQPPRDLDDSYIERDVLDAIPLISPDTTSIGLTGGEPTLLGDDLIKILASLKQHLPTTAIHILSNGRAFKDWRRAEQLAQVQHDDLMMGIPVYSDVSSLHDYVVQADGAFDDTIRGILHLKSVGVRVEIRVVVHKLTYERLPDLARFIRRNLTFCDHVAFMGLEITGFTKFNFDKLWIDPKDYQNQLREAANMLHHARIPVSIYNHQLCVLAPELLPFSRKSISDWKNDFFPECAACVRKSDCGGFFSTSGVHRSVHIKPFTA